MTKKKVPAPAQRKRHSPEFKQQALLRAVKDGVAVAARDLGVEPAQLYAWRAKAAQHDQVAEVQQLQQAELARLKREMVRLEEENAFLKKAAAYFAKLPK